MSIENEANENQQILDRCESLSIELLKRLEGFPNFFSIRDKAKIYLEQIRELVQSIRPARLMVVGRCKSGKSSLINAICGYRVAEINDVQPQTGQAKWIPYYHNGEEQINILDTRGLQEARQPLQYDKASTPEESILVAVNERCPDIVLFLCKATELHSASQEDLKSCERIMEVIEKKYKRKLPLIGVLTKCDELAPPRIKLPTTDQRKNNNIETQKNYFSVYLSNSIYLRSCVKAIIPTATYAEYEDGENGLILPDSDERWNIDKLTETIIEQIPKSAQSSFVRMARVKRFQKQFAEKAVDTCSALSGLTAANPLPVVGLPLVGTIQTIMIMYVGFVSGRPFSMSTATDFLSSLGISVVANMSLTALSSELVKLIPGMGSVVTGLTTGSTTKLIGTVAIAFFIDQVPSDVAKKMWQSGMNGKSSPT